MIGVHAAGNPGEDPHIDEHGAAGLEIQLPLYPKVNHGQDTEGDGDQSWDAFLLESRDMVQIQVFQA